MAKLVVELSKQKRSLIEQQSLQATAQVLLQDSGIKSKIIKQYIPVINKQINKYLTQLDFFCNFNIDENFNEIVKSRYRDEFTYDSFSEGEKLRIDISLLMSWRDVARMKNSVNTNLMIFDELFDGSMDETGIGMVLDIFGTMKNTNIFVISHRENIADKFDASIKFEKKNGFTILAD
jgi:DNA repair exonuclease SbcCD ATPase subunit